MWTIISIQQSRQRPVAESGTDRQLQRINGRGGVFLQRTNVLQRWHFVPGADLDSRWIGGCVEPDVRLWVLHVPVRGCASRCRSGTGPLHAGHGRRNRAQEAGHAECTHHAAGRIRLDILNAITNVESSKESVKLAKVAQGFRPKALDAENKSTSWAPNYRRTLLLAQNALAQSESTVVTNQIALRKNLLNLWVKTGTLLDERGIVIQP